MSAIAFNARPFALSANQSALICNANKTRQYLLLQNHHLFEKVWINFDAESALNRVFQIHGNGGYYEAIVAVPCNAIYAWCAAAAVIGIIDV